MDLASFQTMTEAIGAGILIFGMWTMGGVLVGTLARGPALAVGLGLVWTLVLENLLRGVSNLLTWLEPITEAFPGTAAGSLAGAVGATPVGAGDDGTPGVLTVLGGTTAILMVVAYVITFAGIAAAIDAAARPRLTRAERRDRFSGRATRDMNGSLHAAGPAGPLRGRDAVDPPSQHRTPLAC